jgi:hypothetical protein
MRNTLEMEKRKWKLSRVRKREREGWGDTELVGRLITLISSLLL